MNVYYDSGVLMPLYFAEVFTGAICGFVLDRGEPIPLNLFQRLELENAIRQKVFRRDIDAEQQGRLLSDVEADLERGRLVLRPVNWIAALDHARQIGARVTAKTGCRTLDLIHVAIALQWGCSLFVTADDRQLAAAKLQGLETVDLRALYRGRPVHPGEAKERRAPSGAKKAKDAKR